MAAAKGRPTNSELALNFGLVGTSCVAAQATVHWTQTTMVRQQLAAMKGGEQLSFPAAVASIARSEGIAGLYRGFVAAAAREMSYSSLRFGLYEPIKLTMGVGRDSAPWQNVLAGVLAGTAAAAVASPTDLLTIRAMSQTGAEIGIRETARAIIAEGGVRALYRGLDTTMVRAAILGGTKMGTYDTVKQQLRKQGWSDGITMILLASFLSGFAVTCTTSPATNARTMIMASPPGTYSGISSRLIASDCPDCLSSGTYSGMFDCLSAIVRKQGPLGLFQGFSAQWLRFGPYAVVQFVVWEALRDMFGMQPL